MSIYYEQMNISYLGEKTIKFHNTKSVVVINPQKGTRGTTNIASFTNQPNKEQLANKMVSGADFVIETPGEFSFEGNSLHSVPGSQNWSFDDVNILYVSELNDRTNKDLPVDVLILSLDKESLKTSEAVELVKELEPPYVIPIGDEAEQKLFSKEMGLEKPTRETKLTLKASGISRDESQTVLLST